MSLYIAQDPREINAFKSIFYESGTGYCALVRICVVLEKAKKQNAA